MRHLATSRHKGRQWQYWGNNGKCWQPHANDKGKWQGMSKKNGGDVGRDTKRYSKAFER